MDKEIQLIAGERSSGKTLWNTVTSAAVDFMDAQEEDNWLTEDEIVKGVIESGKAVLITQEKIQEVVHTMLELFVKNGILVNHAGVYEKRTIKQTPLGGMPGIVVERKKK